jgi:hypothetical protein
LLERLLASHWRQHGGTALVAGWRLGHIPPGAPPTLPAITVIRPVRGLDPIERRASTFQLPRTTELIFCAGRETDKTVLEAAE